MFAHRLTGVHGSEHASDELVNAVALLDQRHQRSDSTFVVRAAAEVREDELLEGINLILQGHQVGNGLVAFIWVIDRFKTDVLLVLESSCPNQPSATMAESLVVPLNSGCCRWKASLAMR
jgi:hypothetical protein